MNTNNIDWFKLAKSICTAPEASTKHTPGPWKIAECGEFIVGSVTRFNDRKLSCICILDPSENKQEDLANSRLIAAAPEMLELCKMSLIEIEKSNNADRVPLSQKLRKTIARAEGRFYGPNENWKTPQ